MRFFAGPLHPYLCAGVVVVESEIALVMTLMTSVVLVLRLLHSSVWKDLGALNDCFFFTLAHYWLALVSGLHLGVVVLTHGHLTPHYAVCVGSDPATLPLHSDSFIHWLFVVSGVLWMGISIRLYVQKAELQALATTPDNRGLPRALGPHPALRHLRSGTVILLVACLAVVPDGLAVRFFWAGTLNEASKSVFYVVGHLAMPVVIAFVLPAAVYNANEKAGGFARKWFRDRFTWTRPIAVGPI